MAKRLKLSVKATDQMYRVKTRLNLESSEDLWTLRIALSRSLQIGEKFKIENVNIEKNIGKGKEIDISTLVQKDGIFFRALFCQFYNKNLTDDEYEIYLIRHIENGLDIIDNETRNFSGYDYLIAIAKKGISDFKFEEKKENNEENIEIKGYDDIIKLRIGIEKDTNIPLIINFNKTDEHSNNYMGIVGKPGSGKTYFVKYLLKELRKNSEYQTNFIIFDYAKGDIADDIQFIKDTKAELIDITKMSLPLNIFRIQNLTSQAIRFTAERVVSIVKNVEANIGKVQEQNLYDAIISSYEKVRHNDNPYPDFYMIRQELEIINDKPDSLTSVFRPLTEHNLFVSSKEISWDTLINKTLIIDINKLPVLKDLCVYFILNELYKQLMILPDSKVNPDNMAREMRIVIVLDEAHHFLRSKKRVKILEDIIREIRSKGASVILLSQSPDDYDQAEFNFLELLEFVYVLNCNPSSPKFIQQKFGLSSDQAKRLVKEINTLKQGEAISSIYDKITQIKLCK